MSLLNQENIIGQERLKNHNIKKYEFKSITNEMIESSKEIASASAHIETLEIGRAHV